MVISEATQLYVIMTHAEREALRTLLRMLIARSHHFQPANVPRSPEHLVFIGNERDDMDQLVALALPSPPSPTER